MQDTGLKYSTKGTALCTSALTSNPYFMQDGETQDLSTGPDGQAAEEGELKEAASF